MNQFLGIFQTYAASNLYWLPGSLVDYQNLMALFGRSAAADSWRAPVMSVNETAARVLALLAATRPTLAWFSGHGVLTNDKVNTFVTDIDRFAGFDEDEILNVLARDTTTSRCVYVFDFCHSCSMLNLKYYYAKGVFFQKMLESARTLFDDDTRLVRVSISGASDFGTTDEDENGGKLTQYLISLLRRHGFVSLRMFEDERPPSVRAVISLNCIINDTEPIISLSNNN